MRRRIFYHIYPLGLLGTPKTNSFRSQPTALLADLVPWLEHLRNLGCDALYVGPVFESGSHGYDTIDYYRVDRRLGTNDLLRHFIREAHKLDIKIVLDGVFNHVGRDFFAFKDLQSKGPKSKYRNWFSNVDFEKRSPMGDAFSYDAWSGHYPLVELNLKNPEVQNYLFGAVRQWIDNYKIDGLRLDTADVLDFNFMRALRKVCKKRRPDFWLMGEVVQGDYTRWVNDRMLDSVTNYDWHTPFYESFNLADFHKIATVLDRQYGTGELYKKLALYTFVDNHDVNRAASSLHGPEHLFPLYMLLLTLPGIPAIYYGSEWGFEGKKEQGNDDLLRPMVNLEKHNVLAKHPLLFNALKKFIFLRKNNDALALGSYEELLVSKEQFAFLRKYRNEWLIVIINASRKADTVNLPMKKKPEEKYKDLLNEGFGLASKNGVLSVEVPSCWGRILVPLEK